jgi:hypothetical protein
MFPATEDPVKDPIRSIDWQKVLPVEPFIKDKQSSLRRPS